MDIDLIPTQCTFSELIYYIISTVGEKTYIRLIDNKG